MFLSINFIWIYTGRGFDGVGTQVSLFSIFILSHTNLPCCYICITGYILQFYLYILKKTKSTSYSYSDKKNIFCQLCQKFWIYSTVLFGVIVLISEENSNGRAPKWSCLVLLTSLCELVKHTAERGLKCCIIWEKEQKVVSIELKVVGVKALSIWISYETK